MRKALILTIIILMITPIASAEEITIAFYDYDTAFLGKKTCDTAKGKTNLTFPKNTFVLLIEKPGMENKIVRIDNLKKKADLKMSSGTMYINIDSLDFIPKE